MTIIAKHVVIKLFEGERSVVEDEVNTYLSGKSVDINLVDIKYNYQAADWGRNPKVGELLRDWVRVQRPSHGAMVITEE